VFVAARDILSEDDDLEVMDSSDRRALLRTGNAR
jgi:hypothetical protein